MTNHLQREMRRPSRVPRPTGDYRIPAIDKYAYCLCLHVKPTTIFIAVFKLIRALIFASQLLNLEFSANEQVNDLGQTIEDRHKSTDIAVNLLLRMITAAVSGVGIYAVISGRATLLMPLYAMLLVDFFFALPPFYNRDLESSFADSLPDLRYYQTSQYNRYSMMLLAILTTICKIYFLCVIWKCYRYLRLIELVSPIRFGDYPHIQQSGPQQYPIVRVLSGADATDFSGIAHNTAPPPYESIASTMKPPNYEEAIKSPAMIFPTSMATIGSTDATQSHTVVIDNPSASGQHARLSVEHPALHVATALTSQQLSNVVSAVNATRDCQHLSQNDTNSGAPDSTQCTIDIDLEGGKALDAGNDAITQSDHQSQP